MSRLSLQDAKLRLRIPALWHHFGFAGEPKTSCRAPWREDHKPSFSVSADGLLWNDFASGEGGDPIDFLARASGLGPADACRKFLELAGAGCIAPARTPVSAGKRRPQFPDFERGSAADCSAVAMLGGCARIHPHALPHFAGKRVRIFGHDDEPGRAAVDRWAVQLESASADVDAFDFTGLRKTDGSPVKDLNDSTSVHADDFEANRELWRMMP